MQICQSNLAVHFVLDNSHTSADITKSTVSEFALAYLSHLPDIVDFVMSTLLCELSNKKRTTSLD